MYTVSEKKMCINSSGLCVNGNAWFPVECEIIVALIQLLVTLGNCVWFNINISW